MNNTLASPEAMNRSATETLIDVRALRKSFKSGHEVLRGIDLDVPRGTVLGLLGKTARARRRSSNACWDC